MFTLEISELGKPVSSQERRLYSALTFQKCNDFKVSPAKDRLMEERFGLSTPGEEDNNAWPSYSALRENVSQASS